jgi:hypothetical protein
LSAVGKKKEKVMSQFITDEDLETFVRDVLQEEPRRKETALRLSDRIRVQREYDDRAKCSCAVNSCECYLPMEIDPAKIQAGDSFRQTTPTGRTMDLFALGVRTMPGGQLDIFTAGWPPAVVRVPDHGTIAILEKGKGITKAQLRHRRERAWGSGWDDGL